MWSKQYECCIDCGTTERKHNSKGRCGRCHQRQTKYKITKQCVECGGDYLSSKYNKTTKYCQGCLNVAARKAKRDMGLEHTLESVTVKAHAAIKSAGHYLNRPELFKCLGITDKVWTRLGLSVYDLNVGAGFPNPRIDRGTSEGDLLLRVDAILADVGEWVFSDEWTDYGVDIGTLRRVTGLGNEELNARAGYTAPRTQSRFKDRKDVMESAVKYVKECGHPVTTRDILNELRIDYYSTWLHFNCNAHEVCELAGYPITHRSSLEYMTELALRSLGLDEGLKREVRFDNCRSVKGHRLRFDFYVLRPCGARLLIEVDGQQHTNTKSNWWSTSIMQNDSIKNFFCLTNGIPLLRISYKDCTSVENVEKIITEFLELL